MISSPSNPAKHQSRVGSLAVILIVAVGSYGLGWLTASRSNQDVKSENPTGTGPKPAVAHSTVSREPGIYRIPVEIEKLVTGGTIDDAMFRIFAETDPVKRSAAFNLLVSTLTAENVLEAKEAMFQLTQKTGKTAHGEWGLLLGRIGELVGEKGMDSGNGNDKHRVMMGWAKVHPDEALAFIGQQSAGDQGNLRNAWLYGVCRENPGRVLTCLLSDPDFAKQNGGDFMKEACKCRDWMQRKPASSKHWTTPPGDVENSAVFRSLFIELTNAKLFRSWQSGTTQETCDWLEKQKGAPYLIEPLVGHAAYDLTFHGGPSATLAWLQRMDANSADANLLVSPDSKRLSWKSRSV